jgi:hypothetical protein
MTAFLLGFLLGIFFFVGYGAYRAVNSDGWDDSNVFNWLRLLGHVYIHPEDFGQLYYDHSTRGKIRPFDYISKDEFSENFPDSRP